MNLVPSIALFVVTAHDRISMLQSCVGSDVIYTERRGQSQKPEEIYQLIEELVPGGTSRPGPWLKELHGCVVTGCTSSSGYPYT